MVDFHPFKRGSHPHGYTPLWYCWCQLAQKSFLFAPSLTLLATDLKLVDRGLGPSLSGFRTETFFLGSLFNMDRLALLLVCVTGFVALGHRWLLGICCT